MAGHLEIWKFPLEVVDRQLVEMPHAAEILHVADQYGHLNLWAIVYTEAPLRGRAIHVFGTGHPIPHELGLEYIGTVHMADGLVWHVYDGGQVG